jgi:hypothetical protein
MVPTCCGADASAFTSIQALHALAPEPESALASGKTAFILVNDKHLNPRFRWDRRCSQATVQYLRVTEIGRRFLERGQEDALDGGDRSC